MRYAESWLQKDTYEYVELVVERKEERKVEEKCKFHRPEQPEVEKSANRRRGFSGRLGGTKVECEQGPPCEYHITSSYLS